MGIVKGNAVLFTMSSLKCPEIVQKAHVEANFKSLTIKSYNFTDFLQLFVG